MAKVTIREARYFELPRISQVLAQAFWDDNLNGDLIHPHRNKFPADVELYWLRRCRVNYWDYTWRWLVAVSRDEKTGTEAIVGIAEWARLGEGRKKLQCSWYDPRKFPIDSGRGCGALAFKCGRGPSTGPRKTGMYLAGVGVGYL